MKARIKSIVLVCFLLCVLSSCKAPQRHAHPTYPVIPIEPAVSNPNVVMPSQPTEGLRQNVYHLVAPGETLWRISKMYDVPIEDIMKANSLNSPQDLQKGQKLLVPAAAKMKPIVPLYPSRQWKYIVIHHSATDEGSAFSFDGQHKRRGFLDGLGYHFVIDNGTMTKLDGQIEVSPRWIKQQKGAHCKAGGMNYKGIGICLVGNFCKDDISEKQLDSLLYLVNILRDYYRIPITHIIGHGQVKGARTQCPGTRFPWHAFYQELVKMQ